MIVTNRSPWWMEIRDNMGSVIVAVAGWHEIGVNRDGAEAITLEGYTDATHQSGILDFDLPNAVHGIWVATLKDTLVPFDTALVVEQIQVITTPPGTQVTAPNLITLSAGTFGTQLDTGLPNRSLVLLTNNGANTADIGFGENAYDSQGGLRLNPNGGSMTLPLASNIAVYGFSKLGTNISVVEVAQ
jgi:hypothetical protein